MRSSLFAKDYFYILYREIGLSQSDIIKMCSDKELPKIPDFVNQTSVQMATSRMIHGQCLNEIFHILLLILTPDRINVFGGSKSVG